MEEISNDTKGRLCKEKKMKHIVSGYLKIAQVLLDVAIPGDNQIEEKQLEKLAKYKDLEIEILTFGERKTTIPFVLSAVGAIPKSLKKYLANTGIDKITMAMSCTIRNIKHYMVISHHLLNS